MAKQVATIIRDLHICVKNTAWQINSAVVDYSIDGAPRGSCTVGIIGKWDGQNKDLIQSGLTSGNVEELLKLMTPGTAATVHMDVNDGGDRLVLFSGYVASTTDVLHSTGNHFEYTFNVTLTTPETLIPTNPVAYTFSIAKESNTVVLKSDAMLAKSSLGSQRNVSDKYTNISVNHGKNKNVNIAKIVAEVLDLSSSNAQVGDMGKTIASCVDVDNAPCIALPKASRNFVDSLITEVSTAQSRGELTDWSIFVHTLAKYFMMVVPVPGADSDNPNLRVVKGMSWAPWDSEKGASVSPSDYVSFQNTHISAFDKYFRAVAVAYPEGPTGNQASSLVSPVTRHYLAVAGYDAHRNPKWYTGEVQEVNTSGYQLGGVELTAVKRVSMPNWAVNLYSDGASPAEVIKTRDALAKALAIASVSSQIGSTGSLMLHTLLIPTLSYVTHIGEVVEVSVPVGPQHAGSPGVFTPMYGVLRSARIAVILESNTFSARGQLVLSSARSEKEQKVFAVQSGLFADESNTN